MTLRDSFAEAAALIARAADSFEQPVVDAAIEYISTAHANGKSLLVCENGGSADTIHITAELVGRFLHERRGLRVICLSDNPAVLTSWSKDHSFESVFARQVEACGGPGSVLLGLSTSGTSRNVVAAFEQARRVDMRTVAPTGEGGGTLAPLSDHLFAVPSRRTPLMMEL